MTNAEALNELGSAAIMAMGLLGLLVLWGNRREDAVRQIFLVSAFLTFAAALRFSVIPLGLITIQNGAIVNGVSAALFVFALLGLLAARHG